MNITNVMTKIDDFIHQAKTELSCANEFQAQRQLVKLRELLNSLPELEAGGGIRRCRVCGCTDIKACPDGCYWITEDLCSLCDKHGWRERKMNVKKSKERKSKK